ncbi:peptide chain release factor [Gigaspora margarita]|uniref:Peptide chain release factor n=1 Tax=Gigaspora margarita TaxID=4874 RepID=A0A8H3XF15_GIGMA|nr:peptide chain release factor [Gigaspora margarita]
MKSRLFPLQKSLSYLILSHISIPLRFKHSNRLPVTSHFISKCFSSVSITQESLFKDSLLNSKVRERLEGLIIRHSALSNELDNQSSKIIDPDVLASKSKELSDLSSIIVPYQEMRKVQCELIEIDKMINESSDDEDFKKLMLEEYQEIIEKLKHLEQSVVSALIPKDSADQGNAVLEIRAGSGGDEAALFAADILNMYERYAFLRKWKFERLLIVEESAIGAIKEATTLISGKGVFGNMRYESGVHRVQRVPVTDSAGRVHTSTVTVAILPQPTEADVNIRENDLRIDYYRASGKGGQHVNKTSSAVRITHNPTGCVVAIQDERSQPKNKAKALQILRARLYDMERNKLHQERSEKRRQQVGTGDRSEKIRTYNFAQNRVTDHRINLTLHELDNVLNGESLQTIFDGLKVYYQSEALQNELH